MANCVNKSLPEFKEMATKMGISPVVLAAKISVWQEDNGIDKWPTPADIVPTIPDKLEDKLKEWFNVAGVQYTPVDNVEGAVARADTLRGILEVVEGRKDITTLLEEAAHFLVDMLPENHPILQTMMSTITKTDMYAKVVEEYSEAYEGNENKLKKEAIGKLIAQEVLNQYSQSIESEYTKSKFKKFTDAILNWIKAKFRFLSSNTVYQETEAYKLTAQLILDKNKTQELINLGGLKKYSESNWNSDISDYYYQLSTNAEATRDTIIDRLSKLKATLTPDKTGYITVAGRKMKFRVSDHVKDFYRRVFKSRDLSDTESNYRRLKGTFIHKIEQILVNRLMNGQPISERFTIDEAKADLLNDDEFVMGQKEFGDELWALGSNGFMNLRDGVKGILDQINTKSKEIQKLSNTQQGFTVFTEVSVYDEDSDTAGTIDLLVVYPNGTVGIYDYKSMNFFKSKEVSTYKLQAFEIQLDWYKRILIQNYGVQDFAETRIVPIEVRLNSTGKVSEINMDNKDYLEQIPIKEFTGNKSFDEELQKLYGYIDTLRAKLKQDYKDEGTKLRLFRIEKAVREIIINKEITFLNDEVKSMAEEFNNRSKIDSTSPGANPITDEDLNEMIDFINNTKGIISRFDEYLGSNLTKEQAAMTDSLLGIISKIEGRLFDKAGELANKVLPNQDINTPHKQLGFFSRIFNPTFDIDSPIIKKIQKLIQDMSFSVVTELNTLVEEISAKKDNLEKWASSKGISLLDAYKLMINEKTGNLVSTLSSEYYADMNKQMAIGGIERTNWFNKYYTFDKAKFTDFYNRRLQEVIIQYPGKYNQAKREAILKSLNEKYNAEVNTSAINENNRFLKINLDKIPKKYFNEKWLNIQAKGNEILKEFYDSYIDYNLKFAQLTGRDINKNFVAEIRKDALSRAISNGLGSLFNVKGIFMEMMEVRAEDPMSGSVDTSTGEVIPAIPLLFTNPLTSGLSSSETKAIEAQAAQKYTKGSEEYLEYARYLFDRVTRDKGLKTKSYDLTHSLILFAKSAYTFKHLRESEAYVKNLKYFVENGGGRTNIIDGGGAPITNKFTNKMMTVMGVPTSEVDLLENIIQGVWYGRSVLDKDRIFNEKSVTDSEGNVIGRSTGFSKNKSIRNLMQYVSIRALGLNPFAAVGNMIGTRSNLMMLAIEGNAITKANLMQATTNAYKDREKYFAGVEILQPYAHNRANEIANDLSATKLERMLTVDNAFILMKHPDEQIDRLITNSMLLNYGVSPEGRILNLSKLPDKTKSLYEHLVKENNSWKFEGVSQEELAKFRVAIFKKANKIKGSTPEYMKASYSRTLTGQVLMHFRSWMPGLISTRFKDVSYDPEMEELDAGRFRVFWGELVNSGGFAQGLKEFTTLATEVATFGYGGLKKTNIKASQIAFDKFKLTNPEEAKQLTLDDFVQLRTAKLKGMAAELRMYFLMAMLVMLAKSMIPDDEKKDVMSVNFSRFVARNSYLMANRGFLELSFFLQPSSVKQILKQPIPLASVLFDGELILRNTITESYELLSGDVNKQDKSPWTYYFVTRAVPVGKTAADTFDIYDSFKTK